MHRSFDFVVWLKTEMDQNELIFLFLKMKFRKIQQQDYFIIHHKNFFCFDEWRNSKKSWTENTIT